MSTAIEAVPLPAEADHRMLRRLMAEERRIKNQATDMLERSELEGRDLTDEEKAELESLSGALAKAREATGAERDRLKLAKVFLTPDAGPDAQGHRGGDPVGPDEFPPGAKSLGELWVASGVWKGLKNLKARDELSKGDSPSVMLPTASIDYAMAAAGLRGFKAASSPLLESNWPGGFGNPPGTIGPITTLVPGIETPGLVQLPPTISDLLRVVPVRQGNSVTYRIQKSRTMPGYPASQPVAEGAVKPTYATEFDVVQVPMKKLAAITKISDEWFEDDDATVAFLNAELPLQIRQVEESWLAALLYAGVTDATALGYGTVSFDSIAAAISTIQTAGFNPNAMLIRPQDWWNLSVSKLGTGAGDKEYVGGGPFGNTGNPWGLRVVQTPYATAGHPLIGDFTRGGWIARRGGIRMDSTNSDVDDFEKNIIALRVELREAFQKVYPEAFKTAAI